MNYRYPGPQSFTEEDEQLFFGRNRETKALYDLIMVQPLVVLFAKSGMGKTSLLQAGIIPRLRFTEYDPLIFRLNDVALSPEQQVLRKIAPAVASDTSLWTEIIHYNREHQGTPLLIFDQFEELFTLYSDEQRAALVRQLADVINGTVPSSIRQRILEGLEAGTLNTSDVAELERKPRVKIVLSIRSDLLHYLHLLSPEIPSILRNRFELLGLRPEQAQEAIVNPAVQAQEVGDYSSPSFKYSSQALTQILSYLSRRQHSLLSTTRQEPEIESFQLQLLCEYIERKIIAEREKFLATHAAVVTPEFYGGEPGIEQILSQFYSNTLAAIPDARQREKARRLLEDHLMKNERRVSVDEITIVQTHGVSSETLDLLVNKRLLRQDVRETGDYFEVSHDTLLGPILRSKLEWEAKQAAIRVRRLVAIVLGMLVIVAGAVAFGLWAFEQKKVAQQTAINAYANDLAYKSTTALHAGDRNIAFRLAEFAHRYVETDNPSVLQALIDALYYHDNPDTTRQILPRVSNLEGHFDDVNGVAFSPDGKWLATGAGDGTTKIWDLASGKILNTLYGSTSFGNSIVFSPDGKTLATEAAEYTAKLWDPASGEVLGTFKGHTKGITSLAFSPDGKRLVTGSYDNTAKIWDLNSGKIFSTLEGHTEPILSVAFSPDGKKLATGAGEHLGKDNTAKIWDLTSGKILINLEGHNEPINSVTFSPDGKRLATGSFDNMAKIWDTCSGEVLMNLEGHTNGIVSVAFSPDGKRLVTGSYDNTAKIWDLNSGKILMDLKGHTELILSVAISPDGKRLATGSKDRIAKIWNLVSDKALNTLEGHNGRIISLSISPDGKKIATGSFDNTTKIWDLATCKALTTLTGHTDHVTSVKFSPDGKMLATGSKDNTAKIWDILSNKTLLTLNAHTSIFWCLAFSPDGKMLATGANDNTAKIWNLKSGEVVNTLKGHTDHIESIAFSSDGKMLATGSRDTKVKIWKLLSKTASRYGSKALTTFEGNTIVNDLAFSPNGKMLAIGSHDKTAVWDLRSSKTLMTLKGHTDVISIMFSPDGKKIATGSYNNTAKIWDIVLGKTLFTLKGHSDFVTCLAFSPNGKRLISGSFDNTAKIWELDGNALIQRWNYMGRPAGLNLTQLQQYNLETLLDLHPDNEAKLIATREVWQIKAFADLAAAQAGGSNVLSRVEVPYSRAERLYTAALSLQDEPLIRMDYAKMLRRWAEVYEADGLKEKAGALMAKADGLWKESKN